MRITNILNKTDVNNMIARLSAISTDLLEMQDGVINDEKPKFKTAFSNGLNEAGRILKIKKILSKAGDNL